jgi:Dolichyl-phosphate-mannose-protein mannosyltransferase
MNETDSGDRFMSIIEAPGGPVSPGRVNRRGELAAALFLLVCGVGWPVLVSVLACPLTIPRNDAFGYSKIAQTLADHGTIHLVGYGRMSLIGQIVLAQPLFGLINNREIAGNVFGIVMMSIAIILSYALARRFLRRGLAIVVTLALLFAPGLANTTPTFMTEPTFLCLTVGTLLAGVLSFQSPRYARQWLVLSAVLGFAGFTVREFGVVAPLAVIAALAIARRVSRAFAASVAGAVVIACAAFYEWHQHLSGLEGTALQLHPSSLSLPVLALFTLGFYVLPATLGPGLSLLRARDRLPRAGAIAAAVLALPALATRHKLFSNDMLGRFGVSGQAVLSGTRPELFPRAEWIVLNAIALVGGICLVVVVIDLVRRRLRNRERDAFLPLEAFTVAYAVVIAMYGTVFNMLDDRYIWPLVLPVAIIVVGRTERSVAAPDRRGIAWLAVAPLLVLFVTSTFLNQDVAGYDGARWEAAQALVDRGASSSQVDGGLEWEGAHSPAITDLAAKALADTLRVSSPSDPYYAGFWAPARRCFVVSNSPPDPGGRLLGTRTYRSQLGLRTRTLYVWLRPGQACESELAALRPAASAA